MASSKHEPLRSTMPGQQVYLGGPVRWIGRSAAIDLRLAVNRFYLNQGAYTFSPPGAWDSAGPIDEEGEARLQSANDYVLANSAVFAAVYAGVESTGTAAEARLAAKLGIPIHLFPVNGADEVSALDWLIRALEAGPAIKQPVSVTVWANTGYDYHDFAVSQVVGITTYKGDGARG